MFCEYLVGSYPGCVLVSETYIFRVSIANLYSALDAL